eukprot:6421077-Amphidinium_carterae.2
MDIARVACVHSAENSKVSASWSSSELGTILRAMSECLGRQECMDGIWDNAKVEKGCSCGCAM